MVLLEYPLTEGLLLVGSELDDFNPSYLRLISNEPLTF